MRNKKLPNRPVLCEECHKSFKIKRLKTKQHRDGVEGLLKIQYFECPDCKKKYVTFIENDKIKKMMQERNKLVSKIKRATQENNITKIEDLEKERRDKDSRINTVRKDLLFFFSKYA